MEGGIKLAETRTNQILYHRQEKSPKQEGDQSANRSAHPIAGESVSPLLQGKGLNPQAQASSMISAQMLRRADERDGTTSSLLVNGRKLSANNVTRLLDGAAMPPKSPQTLSGVLPAANGC